MADIATPDAPDPPLDRYDGVWTYRDAAGTRIGYVVRLDPNERRPKKLIQGITWGRRIWIDDKGRSRDETGWHHKHPARPMQLYGLDRLGARPEAPVIITEGEKACDAAAAMFLDHVCVTWPRGGENVPYADWTALAGRSVIIWPDNDPPNRKGARPGLEAARKVAEQLHGIAASVRTLRIDDLTKGDQPDGEDAADIAIDDPAAWLAAHLPTPDDDPPPYEPDGPAETQPLKVTLFNEIEAALDVHDFVEDLLTEGGMSIVFGESNCGKTFLVLDLALHVARGSPWFGREIAQGGVLYVALEGGIGIRNRIAAYRQANGLEDASLQFALITQPISLLDPQGVRALIFAINGLAQQFEGKLKLVVVDTASRAIAGGDENSSVDMGKLIANADIIRSATAAHISFIHHSGKDANRGARGWSGLRGAIDTEIEVTEDNGTRRVQIKKQRDLERGSDFFFTLETVELGANRRGKPVQSCIVRPPDQNAPAGAPADPARSVTGYTRRAYELLRDLTITGGSTGYAGMPAGILSVTDDAWREVFYNSAKPGATAQARRKAFQRAGEKLIELKMIGMSGSRVWIVARQQTGQDNDT